MNNSVGATLDWASRTNPDASPGKCLLLKLNKGRYGTFPFKMKRQAARNYLKAHRREAGLSQREIGELLGYKDPGQVSRHERSMSVPPLVTALAYELIFRVPVSVIFMGMHQAIEVEVENKLRQLEEELGNRTVLGRGANLVAQKLVWLNERKGR